MSDITLTASNKVGTVDSRSSNSSVGNDTLSNETATNHSAHNNQLSADII